MAEFESALVGERVESTIGARAASGRKHAQWPFGYVDGQPTEPQASVVRRIFEAAADGQSQRDIAVALNAEGIRTAKGNAWGQSQVKNVLDNVKHIGRIETNGEVHDGGQPPIVSMEVWDRFQALRAANKRSRNGSSAGRKPKGPYLFTKGLLRCIHCDAAMVPHTTSSGWEAYVCNTRKSQNAAACEMRNVPRKLLDAAVFDYFERVCVDIEATKQELRARTDSRQAEVAARLREAKGEVAKAASAIELLDRDYTEADIDAKTHQRLIPVREAEQSAAEANLGLLEQQAATDRQGAAVSRGHGRDDRRAARRSGRRGRRRRRP